VLKRLSANSSSEFCAETWIARQSLSETHELCLVVVFGDPVVVLGAVCSLALSSSFCLIPEFAQVENLRSGARNGLVLDRFSLFIPCCLSYIKCMLPSSFSVRK